MRSLPCVLTFLLALAVRAECGTVSADNTALASSTKEGAPAATLAASPALSKSGRFVVFTTRAANLLAGFVANGKVVAFRSSAGNLDGAGNSKAQVFRKDLGSGTIVRVSENSVGAAANLDCNFMTMSANGRVVAFTTTASNMGLSGAATGGRTNAFLRDLKSGATILVAPGPDGAEANGSALEGIYSLTLSRNAKRIGVGLKGDVPPDESDTAWWFGVIDRKSGDGRLMSITDGDTIGDNDDLMAPALSGNGKRFAFNSLSDQLLCGSSSVSQLFVGKA